jgi:6-pyruvoyltetrahydropterin/6-carboxytetrahydropterin synthase
VYDFGNTKWIKAFLEENFDHTIAVDSKDPKLDDFKQLETVGIAKIVTMDGVGCEKFAEHVYSHVAPKVLSESEQRVRLVSVEVFEHGANSAICIGD